MKRFAAILLLCAMMLVSLSACAVKETVALTYGEKYQITNKKLDRYENLYWSSSDASIAEVQYGRISAVGAGTTLITAEADGKEVAEFTVKVSIVPITGIVLSAKATEVTEEETFKLEYTLFPEDASDVGLSWKSADEAVATVDASGVVTGIAPGQTTISISTEDGVIDTCSVTVKQKPAYERLSKKEKAFVDLAMKHLDAFKNPDSVIIKEIQEATLDNTWTVKVSAQNGFGGNTTTVYMLDDNFGFWNWGSFDIDVDLNITPDETYDIQLINDAIDELR